MRTPPFPILTFVLLPVLVVSCETRSWTESVPWVCPPHALHFTADGETTTAIPMREVPAGASRAEGSEIAHREYIEVPLPPHEGRVRVAVTADPADHYAISIEGSRGWESIAEIGPRPGLVAPGLHPLPEVEVSVGHARVFSLYALNTGSLGRVCFQAADSAISPWLWLILGLALLYVALRALPATRRWAAALARADLVVALLIGASSLVDPVVLVVFVLAWLATRPKVPREQNVEPEVGERPPPERTSPAERPSLMERLSVERVSLGALITTAVGVYIAYGTETVGGCDSWSYFSQSMWMRGAGLDMGGSPSPGEHPSLIPMCHALVDGDVRSIFPPGFPALLASAGVVGLEFLVNPILGATSIGLVYALLVRRTGHRIALLTAALWASAPIVLWASTRLMSDLSATVFLLASLYGVMRGRAAVAGLVAGLSVAIRPTNILFAVAAAPAVFGRRLGLRFFAGVAMGGALWGAIVFVTFGPPWESPYVSGSGSLLALHPGYLAQAGFFLHHIAELHPCMVCLAGLALYHRVEGSLTLLLVFSAFVSFYGLWTPQLDTWWESRFVLPSYAALHLLGGLGLAELLRHPRWAHVRERQVFKGAVALACGGTLLYQALFAGAYGLLDPGFERAYRTDSERVAQVCDERSLIGSYNFSGPLRLYAHRTSFILTHPDALWLVEEAFADHRPVYAVMEAWEVSAVEALQGWRERYELVDLEPLEMWSGLTLRRVLPVSDAGEGRAPARVIQIRGELGASELITDGAFPTDGSPWNGSDTLRLAADGAVTLRLPHGNVTALRVSADGNDSYVVEGSDDGEHFTPTTVVPPAGHGMRTRLVPLDQAWRFVRISPGEGDGAYSIGEVAPIVSPGTPLDLRAAASDGWSVRDDGLRLGPRRASLGPFELAPNTMHRASVTISRQDTVPPDASVTFSINGAELERHWLARRGNLYHLVIPARMARATNVLTLELDDVAAAHADAIVLRRVLFQTTPIPPLPE